MIATMAFGDEIPSLEEESWCSCIVGEEAVGEGTHCYRMTNV